MRISLKSFKCFQDEISIDFGPNNALICGENGSGKSSVVEAFRWTFAQDGVKNHIKNYWLRDSTEQAALLNDAKTKLNNKVQGTDFEVMFYEDAGNALVDNALSALKVFIISPEDTNAIDTINLKRLIESSYLKIDNFNDLISEKRNDIKNCVNTALKESFMEDDIQIEIEEGTYQCTIKDSKKQIEESENLTKYFNEAKLRLINTLLLLSVLDKETQRVEDCYILLDDPVNSLDATNRTFLVNYILEKFKKQHIYVFTHNIGFSRLWHFITDECKTNDNAWKYLHLYEKDNKHFLAETRSKELSEIENSFNNASRAEDIEEVGNDLRKYFESRLVLLSELLRIDTKLESKDIIETIRRRGHFYADQKKGAVELIEQIEAEINKTDPNITDQVKLNSIKSAITHYSIDAKSLKGVISDLKLYQKVVMHPMSHYADTTTWTNREIGATIRLLRRLDNVIKGIRNLAPQQI